MPLARGAWMGPYEVLAQLGAGGMGEVYKARDRRLNRTVAIKVLRAEVVGDDDRRRRFLREARLASTLEHPHIVAIYDVLELGDQHAIVMQFVEGVTLRDVLRRGPLPARAALRYASQIAGAIEHAHGRGVIHRDLKPENIVITSDSARVLDFGIAMLHRQHPPAAETQTQDRANTRDGRIAGSPGYMSPEQLCGEGLGPQTDVWAFGCVLYEMLTGRRAFPVVEAPSSGAEPDWTRLPLEVPDSVRQVVQRCLRHDPSQRLRDIADARIEIDDALVAPSAKPRRSWRAQAAAAVLAGAAALGLWQWSRGLDDASSSLLGVFTTPDRAPVRDVRALAVLPLRDLSADTAQAYLADGITQALIDSFSRLGVLSVASVTSSSRYRGTSKPSTEIAGELNADVLLEGAILRSGDRLRISAALVDGRTGQRIWSNVYDRAIADVLTLYDDIAFTVAEEIKATVDGVKAGGGARRAVKPDAYDEYLRGMFFLGNRWMAGGCRDAERSLLTAIERDPDLAQAHAALAWCYAYPDRLEREIANVGPKARAAVSRALVLDDRLALAHAVAGTIRWRIDYDAQGGEAELRRAFELDPNSALVLIPYAESLAWRGNPDRGRPLLDRAIKLDPFSSQSRVQVGYALLPVGQYDQAIAHFQRALELDPHQATARLWLAEAYAYQRRTDEAVIEYLGFLDEALRAEQAPAARTALQRAYAQGGWDAFWRAELALAEREASRPDSVFVRPYTRYTGSWYTARRYARLGDWDAALERSVEARHHLVATMALDPLFAPMNALPRFRALLEKTGAPADLRW